MASAPGRPILATTRQLRTSTGTYAAVAVNAGPHLAPGHVAAAPPHATASDDDLRQRYGLTAREVQVARLLAEGRRNEELARGLRISPFTARRHTERVLAKLGVATRAQVAGRLGS